MSVGIAEIDEAIKNVGRRDLIPEDEIPTFLDFGRLRFLVDRQHESALRNAGEIRRFAESRTVLDLLLDMRNELEPPVRTIEDPIQETQEGKEEECLTPQ